MKVHEKNVTVKYFEDRYRLRDIYTVYTFVFRVHNFLWHFLLQIKAQFPDFQLEIALTALIQSMPIYPVL